MGGSNTRTSVLNRLVRDGEFGQIMTNHFGLDFYLIEGFSIVNSDNASNHFWNDNHVTQMGLDNLRLFTGSSFQFLTRNQIRLLMTCYDKRQTNKQTSIKT